MEVAVILAVLFLGLYGLMFFAHAFGYKLYITIEMYPKVNDDDDNEDDGFPALRPSPSEEWNMN